MSIINRKYKDITRALNYQVILDSRELCSITFNPDDDLWCFTIADSSWNDGKEEQFKEYCQGKGIKYPVPMGLNRYGTSLDDMAKVAMNWLCFNVDSQDCAIDDFPDFWLGDILDYDDRVPVIVTELHFNGGQWHHRGWVLADQEINTWNVS